MKPLDDFLSEETHNPELITSLRQTHRQPAPITASEREETIARARERLSSQISGTDAHDQEVSVQLAGTTASSVLPNPALMKTPRRVRIMYVLNATAAILIVGAIVAASLVLFNRHGAPSQITTSDKQGKYVTVSASAGGFEMLMRLTAGPYFLSEILAVDISLTNHTDQTTNLSFPFQGYACGYQSSYDTGVEIVGGGKPEYTLPQPTDHSCPFLPGGQTLLKPDQTLSVHRYLPLTLSGQVTLRAKTQFYKPVVNSFPKPVTSPLDNHWPSLAITVSPHIPAYRTLSFQRTNTQVTVIAPKGAQLVYMYTIDCRGGGGGGNFGWTPISTTTIKPYDDYCRGVQVDWTFAFAVPGYAILTGEGTFQAP